MATVEVEDPPSPQPPKSEELDLSPGMKFFNSLIEEARFIPGYEKPEEEEDFHKADWFRPDLIPEGKEFVRHNFFAVILSHIVALIWSFNFGPGLPVVLFTGRSYVKHESLLRYLSTVLHVTLWYEDDLVDEHSKATKGVASIRKMHRIIVRNFKKSVAANEFQMPEAKLSPKLKQLHRALQLDVTFIDDSQSPSCLVEDKECPLSQLDVVVTQFAFIGFIVRNPELYGATNRKGLDGFIQIWAMIGSILGIQDRFNVAIHCLQRPGLLADGTKDMEAMNLMFDRLYLPAFKLMPEISLHMIDCWISGISQYAFRFTSTGLLHYMICNVIGHDNPTAVRSLMNTDDWLSSNLLEGVTRKVRTSERMRKITNVVTRLMISEGSQKFFPNRQDHNLEVTKSRTSMALRYSLTCAIVVFRGVVDIALWIESGYLSTLAYVKSFKAVKL